MCAYNTAKVTAKATVLIVPLAAGPAGAADVVSTWNGGNGNWQTASNWSNAPVVPEWPNNGNGGFTFDVAVESGTAAFSGIVHQHGND